MDLGSWSGSAGGMTAKIECDQEDSPTNPRRGTSLHTWANEAHGGRQGLRDSAKLLVTYAWYRGETCDKIVGLCGLSRCGFGELAS